MIFFAFSTGAAPVQLQGRGSESTHHERELVRRPPDHRRSHHVSFLQPVEIVPGKPRFHGPGSEIESTLPPSTSRRLTPSPDTKDFFVTGALSYLSHWFPS